MNYEKLNIREISYIATFGTLWGGCEITLGMVLHNFHLPLTGLLLTFIGSIIALTCARLIDKKRAIIYCAIIAAVLKLLSITSIKLGPFIGIIGSALIAQIVITILNINIVSFTLAAGLMCCWPFTYVLINQTIIYTPKIYSIYQDFLTQIGFKDLKISILICLILLIHFIIGSIAGLFSWFLSNELLKRMNSNADSVKT
ncbi:MAG: hypothetical protein AB1782_09575 [Cyanobacteriota bacterium]